MHLSMIEKIFFCALASAWFVWGINTAGDLLVHAKPLKTAIFKAAAPAPGGAHPRVAGVTVARPCHQPIPHEWVAR